MALYRFDKDIRDSLSSGEYTDIKRAVLEVGGTFFFSSDSQTILELPDEKHSKTEDEELLLLDNGVALHIYMYPSIFTSNFIRHFTTITQPARAALEKEKDNEMYGDQWIIFESSTEVNKLGVGHTTYLLSSGDKLIDRGGVLDIEHPATHYTRWASPDMQTRVAILEVGGSIHPSYGSSVIYSIPNDQHHYDPSRKKLILRTGKQIDTAWGLPTMDGERHTTDYTTLPDDAQTEIEKHSGVVKEGWLIFPSSTVRSQHGDWITYHFAGQMVAVRGGMVSLGKLATVDMNHYELAGEKVLVLGLCYLGCHYEALHQGEWDLVSLDAIRFDPAFKAGDLVRFKRSLPSLQGMTGIVEHITETFLTARYTTGGFSTHRVTAPVDQFNRAA